MSVEKKANYVTCLAIGLGIAVGQVVFHGIDKSQGFLIGVVAGAAASSLVSGLTVAVSVWLNRRGSLFAAR